MKTSVVRAVPSVLSAAILSLGLAFTAQAETATQAQPENTMPRYMVTYQPGLVGELRSAHHYEVQMVQYQVALDVIEQAQQGIMSYKDDWQEQLVNQAQTQLNQAVTNIGAATLSR
ncbi:hypothetical protein [Paraferrimonas sedimenticola]|uniref:Uncharacterized protein n=1 Tax=Paraferrimonas sedimenticola TaxID=375674 RepID=A0AA37S052_9GAMM|nr:hypothetical protein [Paraferrimonas sedimenticola]GLP98002.1 hypothetical protein GCM10007895_33090 [Paraferrimonas sedimenticola]